MKLCRNLSLFIPLLLLSLFSNAQSKIVESSKNLKVAYDVDILVAGGSLAGVEAAIAAADKGASVF